MPSLSHVVLFAKASPNAVGIEIAAINATFRVCLFMPLCFCREVGAPVAAVDPVGTTRNFVAELPQTLGASTITLIHSGLHISLVLVGSSQCPTTARPALLASLAVFSL